MAASDEEMLRAVESYLSGRGDPVRLVAPGTAELSRRPLLGFRIERRFEERGKAGPRSMPGKKLRQISKRPTYTDLATHVVPVPPGFAPSPPVELVLAGSVAEVPCTGCKGGKQGCGSCGGHGRQDCVQKVTCTGCGGGSGSGGRGGGKGGPETCLSCGGSRTAGGPRNRPPSRTAVGQRVQCARCGSHNAACPRCAGRRTMDCPACDGTGLRPCDSCGGSKNVAHEECKGTGFFTTWTEAVITHPVTSDRERDPAPVHLWWPTYRRGAWRDTPLRDVTDKLPADLEDTHRARVEPHLARKQGEVRRRVALRHLPLARVTVNSDADWVYFAFPDRSEADAIKVVRRPSRPQVVRLAGIVSAAVVIGVLVTVLVVQAIG
ncbi:hypothetical protein [Streptomyces sp. B21-083]|uniref:hypothetical protein n=1 Tax=Streptomyces sp. B21-083 TaxID=3039410 RepID=UPI002FF1FCB1